MTRHPSQNSINPPIAVTMGEPAGVGGELTLKVWKTKNVPTFFVIDDAERLNRLAQKLEYNVPICKITQPSEANESFKEALPVLHRPIQNPVYPGKPIPQNADAVIESIKIAVQLACANKVSAVVTNPIHKETLFDDGFRFLGHTEFLAELSNLKSQPVMMLTSPELKVVPVTTHLSLVEALHALNEESIITTTQITSRALSKFFSIKKPRIAIAGLNPHAGEGGTMGDEETSIIIPAITKLNKLGINASGPWPPDSLFNSTSRKSYDAAICMYHDQALIPIKTINFEDAVNVTLGLPFIRTSPDHGTALNIAGTGTASKTSLLAALSVAANMVKRQ